MISGVTASIGRLERSASHVDVRPRLNSFTQLYTVANAGADVLRACCWKSFCKQYEKKPFKIR